MHAKLPCNNDAPQHLAAERWGRKGAPGLVLLHGFLGRGEEWAPLVPALEAEHDILAVDLPGHGSSRAFEGRWDLDGTARAVLATADAAGLERFCLLGYSMGARVALGLALRAPARVARLVLESGSPGLCDPAARQARRLDDDALARRLETEPLEGFLAAWMQKPLFASLRAHPALPALLERRAGNDPHALARGLREMGLGAQPNFWPRLPALRVPTTLVTGALDAKFTRIARDMCACHPDIETLVVEEAGHNVHLEQPEQFIHRVFGDGSLH